MRTTRPLVVAALAGLLLTATPLTGAAHAATRTAASPVPGAVVRPPSAVLATYDTDLSPVFATTISVVGPAPATTVVCSGSSTGGRTASCSPPGRLADGQYSVAVQGREAGVPGASFTDSWGFAVDGTTPVAPTAVRFEPASFTASSTGLALLGVAERGTSVTVAVGSGGGVTRTAVTTAGPDGAFAVDVPDPAGLTDGPIEATASSVDAAGNTSPAAVVAGSKDSTRPAAPVVDAGSGRVGGASAGALVLTGTLPVAVQGGAPERGATVAVLVDDEDAGTAAVADPAVPVADDGTWRTAPLDLRGLDDGPLRVVVRATDAAGNSGPERTTPLLKDATAAGAPALDALPHVNAASAGAYAVTGSGEPGALARVSVSDGTTNASREVDVASTGRFTAALDVTGLADGPVRVAVVVVDAAGNASPESAVSRVKDVVVPSVSELAASGSTRAQPASAVTGTTEPGAVVRLVGEAASGAVSPVATATAGGDGRFAGTLDLSALPDGAVTVRAAATDVAGNAGPGSTVAIVRDAVAAPGPPSVPDVRAGDAAVRVLLTGLPDDGGAPTAEWRVTSPDDPAVDVTVPGSATSALVVGLVNGRAYRFAVQASNVEGWSPESEPSVAVVPRRATRTTLTAPASSVAGSPLRLSGAVTRTTGGSGVAAARVVVTALYDDGRRRALGTVQTGSGGAWVLTTTPTQNAVYTAAAAATGADAASASAGRRVLCATRITTSAPATGRASTPLVVSGRTAPAKPGATVTLYQVRSGGSEVRLAGATVRSDGTFRISRSLGRGSYVLVVRIGATRFNTKGASPRFTARRT